jgi:hypothetical protein
MPRKTVKAHPAKPSETAPGKELRGVLLRAIVEMGFIVFLFYSNLLMGEFERSSGGSGKSLLAALVDVVTAENFAIALVTALIGYGIFEFLRKKL